MNATLPTRRVAACSCGQLRALVEGEPLRVSVCHCLACQRRTGSVFGAQARFRRDQVRTEGDGRTWVRIGDEGSRVTFTFCPTCGATARFSVYEERMHTWVGLPAGIEHWN